MPASSPATLSWVLLAAIAREPMTGYELAAFIRKRVIHFWSAHLSQIYPALAELSRRKLVTFEEVPQRKRPAKKVYRITAEGKKALRAYAVVSPEERQRRIELLVKTMAVWLAPRDEALAFYRAHAEECAVERAHYQEVLAEYEKRHRGVPPPDSPEFADWANLTYGAGAMRHEEEWCRVVARQLSRAR